MLNGISKLLRPRRHRFALPTAALAVLLLAALSPLGSRATADPKIDLRYAVSVTGLKIADLALTIAPQGPNVMSELTMRSIGLVAMMSDAFSQLTATSRRAAPEPMPELFHAYYYKSDRTRKITIRYGEHGGIAGLVYDNNGRVKPSDVPPALQKGTIDPLTAFLRLRDWLPAAAAATGPKSITLPVFDGRKRIDLQANYLGRDRYEDKLVYALKVQLIARYGFDKGDSLVTFPDDPTGRWLKVLVSDDSRLVPLRIQTENTSLTSVIELTEDCGGSHKCARLVQ